jgi:DNA-directed RNA polymerase specialized sigma24 family protein
MPNKNRRRPDYARLYPGVKMSDKLLISLKKSDRKMEYEEYDLKRDRTLQDADGKPVLDKNGQPVTLPEREVSLDRLMYEDWDFPSDEPSPEDILIRRMEYGELYRCLDMLRPGERALIDALYFSNDDKGMAEREYAEISGIPQKTINDRKARIFAKLKKLLAD